MASIDNGGQKVTFDYKQEGTSQSFNRVNHGIVSSGIVSMENNGIYTLSGTTVSIPPFRAVLRDDVAEVTVNLYTTTEATVNISASTPYIIGVWNWMNTEENYLGIESVAFNELQNADIIFGRYIFDGGIPKDFDYSRRTWSQLYYENTGRGAPNFKAYVPDPTEDSTDLKVMIGSGSAYINGRFVEFSSPKLSPEITGLGDITNKMKVLVTIDQNGDIDFVYGEDEIFPTTPPFPSDKLTVAVISLESGQTKLFEGDKGILEYVYTNNPVHNQSFLDFRGQPNGLASLDSNGRLPQNQFPTVFLDLVYPVGSLYWSSRSTDPSTLFGGTWTRIKDRFVWAMGDSDTVNDTGGAKTHTLTVAEMPSHNHTFTGTAHTHTISGSTGSESSHTHNINGGGDASSTEPSTLTAWFHGKSVTSGDNNRGHTHSLSNHVHSMQAHTHSLSNHVHSMEEHTHNLAYNNNGSTAWGSGVTTYTADGSTTKALSGTLLVRAMEDGGPAISIKGTSAILTSGSESGSWNGADVQTDLTATNITIDATHSHQISGHTSKPMSSDGTIRESATSQPITATDGAPITNTGASNTTYTGTPVNSSGTATNVTGAVSQTHTHSVTANGWINGKTEAGSSHSHGVGTLANANTTATGTIGSKGGGGAHNNMPPYINKYCWERTA